ncbi:claudin-23-like [Spinachia spinachia]
MPSRSRQEWIRLSLRTPGILIFGMVLAPCGLILNLTSTVAPNWRTFTPPGSPVDEFIQQGIWEVCRSSTINTRIDCSLQDDAYFANQIITVAQGLMVASLLVTLIGLAVAIPGVRCWKDRPNWVVAGLGGLLIFLSGVMTIIPIAWYTHILTTIPTDTVGATNVQVGYCIILGYIGGIFEILAGFVMFIGICRCCGGKNRGEKRVEVVSRFRNQTQPRRVDVPRLSRDRNTPTSSVPYSKDSMDEDVSFPRAKSPAVRSVNTSNGGRPYDVDL